MFQLTLEDDEISHLLDPQTGEINKDNFVSYSLERKLLDAQETNARRKKMQKEDELNRKERLLRRQASFVQPPPPSLPEPEKITEDTERSVLYFFFENIRFLAPPVWSVMYYQVSPKK